MKKAEKTNYNALLFLVLFCVATFGIAYGVWVVSGSKPDNITPRVREVQQTQDALGWGSEILIDKKPNHPAKIRFLLRDKDKTPIAGAAVTVIFKKDVLEKKVALVMVEPGVYRAELDLPVPGLWQAVAVVEAGTTSYQVVKEIVLP